MPAVRRAVEHARITMCSGGAALRRSTSSALTFSSALEDVPSDHTHDAARRGCKSSRSLVCTNISVGSPTCRGRPNSRCDMATVNPRLSLFWSPVRPSGRRRGVFATLTCVVTSFSAGGVTHAQSAILLSSSGIVIETPHTMGSAPFVLYTVLCGSCFADTAVSRAFSWMRRTSRHVSRILSTALDGPVGGHPSGPTVAGRL